jgi:hypothetical protein
MYKTWSLTFREEQTLKVFGKGVLRISESKIEEIRGGWRKLAGKELYDLFSHPNSTWAMKSRRMRWVGHAACIGGKRSAYRILVE